MSACLSSDSIAYVKNEMHWLFQVVEQNGKQKVQDIGVTMEIPSLSGDNVE